MVRMITTLCYDCSHTPQRPWRLLTFLHTVLNHTCCSPSHILNCQPRYTTTLEAAHLLTYLPTHAAHLLTYWTIHAAHLLPYLTTNAAHLLTYSTCSHALRPWEAAHLLTYLTIHAAHLLTYLACSHATQQPWRLLTFLHTYLYMLLTFSHTQLAATPHNDLGGCSPSYIRYLPYMLLTFSHTQLAATPHNNLGGCSPSHILNHTCCSPSHILNFQPRHTTTLEAAHLLWRPSKGRLQLRTKRRGFIECQVEPGCCFVLRACACAAGCV
jgi:hypothetical protein